MKKNSFVDFYSQHNISPVSQNIEDIELHFQRRSALFSSLGLPALLVKDSEILEFGPGSGHNAFQACKVSKPSRVRIPLSATNFLPIYIEYLIK